MKPINAIIIETTKDEFNYLLQQYIDFFKGINFKFNAQLASGQKEAQKIIESLGSRISVVISDITMTGSNESRGLFWIQQLKIKYPDILFIGNSGKNITYLETAVKLPTFDIFIQKAIFLRNDKGYLETIGKMFLSKFNRNTTIVISEKSTLPEHAFKRGVQDRELISLVSQVLYSNCCIDSKVDFDEVILTQMAGGLSGSFVFKMEVFCAKSGLRSVPAVLKVSTKDKALEEANNYKNCVKWVLPYSWRVELLGEGYTQRYGAICYSFVLSNNQSFDSITDHLIAGDKRAAESTIRQIFSPISKTWYGDELTSVVKNGSLSKYYCNEYFTTNESLINANSNFLNQAQRLLGAINMGHKIELPTLGFVIKDPLSELFAHHHQDEYSTTICHGDMNSNNILISEDDSLVFIDFQKTGRKHVFCDFITFESSIRLFFTGKFTNEELLAYEGKISDTKFIQKRDELESLPPLFDLIAKVRNEAINNFPNEPFKNYIYGITVFSFKLQRLSVLDDYQYKKLLAQIFSGISRLSDH